MVTPRLNPKRKFNFSFLEISGELIESIVPSEIQAGKIPDMLSRFLLASKAKKIIVYIFDHNKSNDLLFKSILDYIREIVGNDLDKYYSLIIVVPNPELVLRKVTSDEQYQGKYHNEKSLTPDALLDYLRKESPALVNEWRNWKKSKRAIYKFHIGQIDKNKKGDEVLLKPDYSDSSELVNYFYGRFHGKKIKKSWFKRLIDTVFD